MPAIKNVIVVGATGNLGPSILEAIINSQKFVVSVLTRSSSNSNQFPSSVKVFITDYSPESLETAFNGQDAVVSVVAGAALGEQKKLIDAASAAGVTRFIPSEFGSNTNNKDAQDLVPVFSRKVEVKNYLEEKCKDGLSWTGIVAGPIVDRGLKFGSLGFDIQSRQATIYDSGDRRFTGSTTSQVAAAVVGVLSNPAETANKYVYTGSFTTTQNEILALLESETGEKWSVVNTSSSEKVASGKEKVLSRRDSTSIRPLITAAMYHERGGSDYESEIGLNNDILGLTKGSLEQVVADIVKDA